jgi:PAS domain S-box-containing protein
MDQPIEKIRILILEDVPSDAELEILELQNAGLVFTSLRVDTRDAFEQALDEFKPDIVLADYRLPSYSGHDALAYTRSTHPRIPVIMVTGALGDVAAVDLLKMGARDYVLKDGLKRLAPSIKRTLSAEQGIRSRKLAEGKYLALFTEATDGIVLINDSTAQVIDCNPAFERMCGRTLDELKIMKIWELSPKDKLEALKSIFLNVQEKGSDSNSELELQKPDGTIRPIDISAKLIHLHDHSFIQVIIRDITERLCAEMALRDSEDKFHSITASAQDAIIMINNEGKICYWNAAAEKIFGYPAQETLGLVLHDLLTPERYLDEFRKGFSYFKETGEGPIVGKTLELAGLRKDCTEFPIELSLSAIKRDGLWYAIGIIRDITERKRIENALLRANRALKTLSEGNLALVRATNETELLREVTKILVEKGGYPFAVVDYAENDLEKVITPMAWFGTEESRYWAEHLSWADTEYGQLPVAKAIRSGATQICHDIANDPAFRPWRDAALTRGYVSNIALPLSGDGRTFGGLSIYASKTESFDDDEVRMLEELANDLAYGIITLRVRVEHEQHATILRQSLEQSIQAIAGTVEARDPYTAGHQRRVGVLAIAIAEEMGLPKEQINGIHFASIIHDLGKIRIPAEILSKPGKITDIEYMLIKTHPQAGYDILKDVEFPWPIADIILQHHERLDGSGYPQGLKGAQILFESRIIAVADVVEAMSSHRPYRPTLGGEAAIDEIKRGRGSAYDSVVVDTCLRLIVDKGFQFGVL